MEGGCAAPRQDTLPVDVCGRWFIGSAVAVLQLGSLPRTLAYWLVFLRLRVRLSVSLLP